MARKHGLSRRARVNIEASLALAGLFLVGAIFGGIVQQCADVQNMVVSEDQTISTVPIIEEYPEHDPDARWEDLDAE